MLNQRFSKGRARYGCGVGVLLLVAAVAFPGKLPASDNLKDIALKFNDATASYLIAEKHYKGHGAVQDFQQALVWYTKAAELGHERSKFKLGEMYYYGKGTEKKLDVAAKWLREPAEKGQSEAQYLLGMIYSRGSNSQIAKNDTEALYWFKQAAEEYHPEAAYHAGRMYSLGLGEVVDVEKAKFYLNLAKDYGDKRAEQLLASLADDPQNQNPTYQVQAQAEASPTRDLPLTDLKLRAQSGDVGAQFELAENYFTGSANQRVDVNAALQWYEQAASNGHAASQYKLGMFYYSGQVVTKDLTQARQWLAKAAAQNHDQARQRMAQLDSRRNAQTRSATEILIAQAKQGDQDAQYQLGLQYLNGKSNTGEDADKPSPNTGTTKSQNTRAALKWFLAAAAQGHIDAQFQAGMMYYDPESPQNNQAEQWLSKAAANQHVEAQYYLGSLYENQGQYAKAVTWMDRAVAKNHDGALDMLLMLYLDNRFPELEKTVDKAKVIVWLEKAAKKGYIEAQYRLGELYLQGDTEQFASEAYQWFHKAATKGHVRAQYRLGLMYLEGVGVNKHYTKSAGWLRRAAESGQVDAQFQLGEMYRLGRGLPKKEILATKWYQQAAEQGHMEAKLRLSNRSRY